MEVIAFSVSIRRRRTWLAGPLAGVGRAAGRVALGGGRPPGRPRPGGSGGGRPPGRPRPVPRPASLVALRADLGRPPGRPRPGCRPGGSGGGRRVALGVAGPLAGPGRAALGVADPLAGPGRALGRVALGGGRPPGRPMPGSRPAALFALREDPWPGTLHSPTAPFWSLLFKGFLPQINANLFANLLSYFLPSIVDLLKLGFLSIPPIVIASF